MIYTHLFLFVESENPGLIQRSFWLSSPVFVLTFKALGELQAQSEWYTEAIKFNLFLFQMMKLKLREGGTIVTCSVADTYTHVSWCLLQWPSSTPYCPWCVSFGSIKSEVWIPNQVQYFKICGSIFTFVQVLALCWLNHIDIQNIDIQTVCSTPSKRGKERKKLNIWAPTYYMPDTYVLNTMQFSQQLFDVAIIISKAQMIA